MRLCNMLIDNQSTDKPHANALLALMYFHASRFDARINQNGEIVLYDDQDVNLWNSDMIIKGGYFLNRSASGNTLSKYHLEASIAYWSTQKKDTKIKWENMLQLYNRYLQIEYSPIAALNRTYVLAKANGKQEAIIEAEKLSLAGNQFYFALLGELYTDIDNKKAKQNFQKAILLANNQVDKQTIQRKIDKL
jgi:RNA polymerase sigma-70 factor (ECF subfamily)